MNREEKLKAYDQFFVNSLAGKEFMESLSKMIDSAHKSAEDSPELARDYTQHARGIRQVKEHIDGVMTQIKKGQPMSE